jgi:hypothetical protein
VRSSRDELRDLRANTIVWIVVLVWLAGAYFVRVLPQGPYSDMVLSIFETVVGTVILLVSTVIVIAWIAVLRERGRR